jgi:hypothetical protein
MSFGKYLNVMPEFKLAESYCSKAKATKKQAVDYSSGLFLRVSSVIGLILISLYL